MHDSRPSQNYQESELVQLNNRIKSTALGQVGMSKGGVRNRARNLMCIRDEGLPAPYSRFLRPEFAFKLSETHFLANTAPGNFK